MSMTVIISVLFGNRKASAGWVAEQTVPQLPPIGMPVRIRLNEGADLTMEGQVYRAWPETEAEPGGLLIYGGGTLPPEEFTAGMQSAGWEPLSMDARRVLVEATEQTPVIAAIHEVVLMAGRPGEPGFTVVQRTLRPADPALPLFSQRLRLEAAVDIPEPDFATEGEPDPAQVRQEYLAEVAVLDAEIADPSRIDGLGTGLPVLTVYSAMVRTGVGRVVFWTPSLGNMSVLDLMANDWAMLAVPEQFDPVHFRVERRIELARRSRLTFEETEYNTLMIRDWSIDDPTCVTAADDDLLPDLLREHCRAQIELADLDGLVEEWRQDPGSGSVG